MNYFYLWRKPDYLEKTSQLWNVSGCVQVLQIGCCLFNATFNNISVISWRSVLLVEETWVPGENDQPVASHWQTWSHNVVQIALIEIREWHLVLIGVYTCLISISFEYFICPFHCLDYFLMTFYQIFSCNFSMLSLKTNEYYKKKYGKCY